MAMTPKGKLNHQLPSSPGSTQLKKVWRDCIESLSFHREDGKLAPASK